jgi:hypothetical protein
MSTYPRKYPVTGGGGLDERDHNAIVDRVNGLSVEGITVQSPYSYIVRDNGGFYEAISGTGNLTYGGSSDAGSVDGTDFDAVMNAAVTNGTYIYVKTEGATLTWTTDSIPANRQIESDDWTAFVIQSTNTTTTNVLLGSMTILVNLSIYDKFGVDIGLSPNAPRPVGFHCNAREAANYPFNWPREYFCLNIGEPDVDRPGMAIIQCGIGDGYYAQVYENGACYNAVTTASKGGRGYNCDLYGSGYAFFADGKSGATGKLVYLDNNAAIKSIDIDASVDTSQDIVFTHHAKTAGTMLEFAQDTSVYTGDALKMVMASTFTGQFIKLDRPSGTTKFEVKPDGQIYTAANGITSLNMIDLYQSVSTFTGIGLHMNYGKESGSFSGKFLKCEVNDSPKMEVEADGDTVVHDATKGFILKDRVTSTYYRLKISEGVLGVEEVT